MKQIITFLCLCFFLPGIGFSQYVPMGMKYQAVARDTKGQVLANQELQLNISLYADTQQKEILYSEEHETTTTELGLFTLTIGEGKVGTGRFEAIPWSSKEIWMEVAIRTDDATEFIIISNSKMLSVPYAFHAATADELTGDNRGGSIDPNPSSKNWLTLGNAYTDPSKDKLGTIDSIDMNFVTHNRARMRITAEGNVRMENNLTVNRNVYLNTNIPTPDQPDIQPAGKTINFGDFTVENGSLTHLTGDVRIDGLATVINQKESINPLTGALVVEGGAGIGRNLNVGGAFGLAGNASFQGLVMMTNQTESTNTDNGALVVDGGVGIGKNLNVGGATKLNGILNVGGATTLNNILNVSGATSLSQTLNVSGATTLNNSLAVTKNDAGFVATINNTNSGNGDGLEIKLGKTHPAWDSQYNKYVSAQTPAQQFVSTFGDKFRSWIHGTPINISDAIDFIPNNLALSAACGLFNELGPSLQNGLTGPMDNLGKNVFGQLNQNLKLPVDIDPDIFEGFLDYIPNPLGFIFNEDPKSFTSGLPSLPILGTGTQQFTSFLQVPSLGCQAVMNTFNLDPIKFTNVQNSLTNENQYISFKDVNNNELGSIRAQSIEDWEFNYLDENLVHLVLESVSLDPLDITMGVLAAFSELTYSYSSIGVEYASGHGDYAEWLERMDHDEVIGKGDIVAVAGGKITKDLNKAEQVMAVSGKPIMLGNAPTVEEEPNGNKIAFMGQIPVKIMGPVSSGDYIVGNPSTPGYGIAVNPQSITSNQAHLIVGRSWDTNLKQGPKMINTVIGVDNGSFLKIFQDNQKEVNALDARVKDLEAKLDTVMASLNGYADAGGKKSVRK